LVDGKGAPVASQSRIGSSGFYGDRLAAMHYMLTGATWTI
jgi:hypothetical protein